MVHGATPHGPHGGVAADAPYCADRTSRMRAALPRNFLR